jgi:hypothetical protein
MLLGSDVPGTTFTNDDAGMPVFLLSLLLALDATAARPPDKTLERCRFLTGKIEHYTQLRRGGGTASRMESWRRTRARYEEEYKQLRCYKYRARLLRQ